LGKFLERGGNYLLWYELITYNYAPNYITNEIIEEYTFKVYLKYCNSLNLKVDE